MIFSMHRYLELLQLNLKDQRAGMYVLLYHQVPNICTIERHQIIAAALSVAGGKFLVV